MKTKLLSLILAQVFMVASLGLAETMSFQEDNLPDSGYQGIATFVRSGPSKQDTSMEGDVSIFIGRIATDGTDDTRALLGFDISDIPAGSTIDSIALTLYGQMPDVSSQDKDYTINLHELVGSITESGPTWNDRDKDVPTDWTSGSGGDYNSTVLSSVVDNPNTLADGDVLAFANSTAFVGAAQSALDGSGTLYLFLRATSEDYAERGLFRIWADDSSDSRPHPVTTHPKLTVEYTIPEPGTLALLATGLIGLLCYAWRKRK